MKLHDLLDDDFDDDDDNDEVILCSPALFDFVLCATQIHYTIS